MLICYLIIAMLIASMIIMSIALDSVFLYGLTIILIMYFLIKLEEKDDEEET